MSTTSRSLQRLLASSLGQRLKPVGMRVVRYLGYEFVKLELTSSTHLVQRLRREEVQTVIDTGANQGQFGGRLRAAGWEGRILSIEPSSAAFGFLQRAASASPPWEVRQAAAAAKPGIVTLLVARNSVSSSVFEPAELHLHAAPFAEVTHTEEVTAARIDDLVAESDCRPPYFLKIDTQGYELDVLQGSTGILMHCVYVQAELSLQPMYTGQADWTDVVGYLLQRDFVLIGAEPALVDPETGDLLQIDALFRLEKPK